MGTDGVASGPQVSDGLERLSEEEIILYCRRIGLSRPGVADRTTLEALHFAHIQHIVFENLDIHLGRPIEIDVPRIFDKIVRRSRGGFCYELNSLFGSLLLSLGYEVSLHEARVVAPGARGIPFGHVCLIVKCGGKDWLVDVGFGGAFERPLEIGRRDEQRDEGGTHILEPKGEEYVLRTRVPGGEMEAQYQFDPVPRHLDEFKERCHWTQSSLDSGFTRSILATLPLEGGRIRIQGLNLRTFSEAGYKDTPITPQERNRLLIDMFHLPAEDVDALPLAAKAPFFNHPE